MVRSDELPCGLAKPLRELFDAAFAGRFSEDDWSHTFGGWHVVLLEGLSPVSHAAVVPRVLEVDGAPFECGYVEAVATNPARQRQGLGATVMRHVASILHQEFEMGALSTSRQRFYERLGWERWLGATFVRRAGSILRTPGEDDGVMVLRFGASGAVDLAAAIACEARTGDDW